MKIKMTSLFFFFFFKSSFQIKNIDIPIMNKEKSTRTEKPVGRTESGLVKEVHTEESMLPETMNPPIIPGQLADNQT